MPVVLDEPLVPPLFSDDFEELPLFAAFLEDFAFFVLFVEAEAAPVSEVEPEPAVSAVEPDEPLPLAEDFDDFAVFFACLWCFFEAVVAPALSGLALPEPVIIPVSLEPELGFAIVLPELEREPCMLPLPELC